MQPATSTTIPPKGAPAASGTTGTGEGATRCSSRKAISSSWRFFGWARKLAGTAAPDPARARVPSRAATPSTSGSSVSITRDRALAEAERRQDRAHRLHRPREAVERVLGPGARQEQRARRAVGEERRQRLRPDLGDLVDRDGDHGRGQPVAEAGQRVDQRLAVVDVVEQDHRVLAPCVPIGAGEHPQARHEIARGGQRVGGCARGAGCGALPAAGADGGIDRDVVARGRDRAGRAEVEDG